MKKFTLIFAMLTMVSIVTIAQTQLSWQFANVEVINAGAQLQFDVEVKADIGGTFHRDLQVYFDYNTAGFGSDIVANGFVTVEPLVLMDDYYIVVNSADNTSSKFAVITEASNEMINVGSAADFNAMPTTFTGLLRITIDIMDNTTTSGIAFDQALMDGGQYYQSTSTFDPVKYVDPCLYVGDISGDKLSTLYGAITYAATGGLPIHDCTVTLKQGAVTIGTAITDVGGNYTFSGIDDGAYTIETTCSLTSGGATGQDLFLMNDYLNLVPGATLNSLQKLAGDLNWSGAGVTGDVTGQDLFILNDYVNLYPVPNWTAPDWVFEIQSTSVSAGIGNSDYSGLCAGDINGDFTGF